MRKILALLLVTTSVLAQDASRVLTGSAQPPLPFSIVPQPGFEARTTGWSVTSGTFTTTADVVPTSPTAVARGRYSGKWTPPVSTGAGVILQSDAATIPAGLFGHQCRSQILYKGAALTNGAMTYEVFDGTNILGSFPLSDVTGYAYAQTSTFTCPSSGTLRIRIRSTATTPATTTPLYFDEAFLGDVNALSVGSPVTSANVFGSAPNAAGATVGSNSITLQPADATYPGGVSTVAQSFAGQKTFIDQIVGSITGNAGTATAFLTNPTDCPAGEYASASDASGNFTCSVPPGVTPVNTKGDLYTFDTGISRLPVGANNLCLVADSAETKGIKWASCGTGGPGGMGIGFPITSASANRILYSDASGNLGSSSELAFPSSTTTRLKLLSAFVDSGIGFDLRTTATAVSASAGDYKGIQVSANAGGAGTNINSIIGVEASGVKNSTGTASSVYGLYSIGQSSNGGTTAGLYGAYTEAFVTNGSAATSAYSLYVNSPTTSGSGAITNAYGLYIFGPTVGTNRFPLYVQSGTSFFGGPISQDGVADVVQVNVQGNATQTSDILNVEKSDGTDLLSVTNVNGTKIRGTTTNDNAATGFVGEAVRSFQSVSTNFPATNTWGDLTSISLTAGDWDVSLQMYAAANGGTVSQVFGGISSTSGNSSVGLGDGDNKAILPAPTASINSGGSVPSFRVSISSTTTYYLKYMAIYSAGTPQATGRISARRVR